MGRRSLRREDSLPAILVEGFREEVPSRRRRPAAGDGSLIRANPPGYEVLTLMWSVIGRARGAYERTIGTHRGFHPRMQSRVEHRVECRADVALDAVCGPDELRLAVGRLVLTGDPTHVAYDTVEHEYRVPGHLHLPWSWPDLPMWFRVSELSTTRCALGLSLRSRKRLRYPVRYFHAAHTVLTGLEPRLEVTGAADDRHPGRTAVMSGARSHDGEQQ